MTQAPEHEGQGHGDVTLSFTRQRADGMWLHQSWVICECSALVLRLNQLLGPPAHETVATPAAHLATANAVRGIPGAVHQSADPNEGRCPGPGGCFPGEACDYADVCAAR